ncbi:MAG: molybdenum cofactor guanylyltransferase [Acidobacteriaceae bacterium]|nr:molybdenum cofactor guanylyltransferase [Acidobacteriaceae bacterium]
MHAAGFVLVGGKSTRMGTDKARLFMGSQLLVEEIAGKVMAAAGNVALVGAPEKYRDLPFDHLPDARPGLGPISGVESALASGRAELNLVAGCDMPHLHTGWLQALIDKAFSAKACCVAIHDASGRVHPLCAVYHSSALPVVRAALDAGRLRMMDLLSELKAELLEIDGVIANVNRPEEWATFATEAASSLRGKESD